MIEVKKPILLDSSLGNLAMLHPVKGTLKLEMTDVSEATLTIGEQDDPIPMHSWVKIYNQLGFVGIFRRTSQDKNITVDRTYTLRHGIDILQDSIWNAEVEFSGTKTQFLTQLLDQQTHLINGVKPWVLGSCADASTVTKKIKYENLHDLLMAQVEEGGDYYFTYDQTVWPWQVSLVAKPSAVASEFRLNRNIEKCSIRDNDSELCTRLILNVNAMEEDEAIDNKKQNVSIMRTYNNATAQAAYGVIVKTADIDVSDSLPDGPFPEADAWAADFLARRAAPQLQIQIDGYVLAGITGDTWDETRIATMCRVALPDYAESVSERVVTVSYPDLYGTPDRVSVSLANALPTVTKSMKTIAKEVSKSGGGGRATARELESFSQHFEYADSAGNILKQAGMYLDADGLLVYADDYVNMVGAKFNVQADKIGMVVGTYDDGRNYIKAGEIALSINSTTGESTAYIDAHHVNISASNTAYTLAGDLEHTADGKLVIKNAAGMYVRKTIQGVAAEFGVYDENNLTGGVMVTKINGQTTVKISGNVIDINGSSLVINAARIDINGVVTALESYDISCGGLTTGAISCTNVSASDTIDATGGYFSDLYVGETEAYWCEQSVVTGITVGKTNQTVALCNTSNVITGHMTTNIVTSVTKSSTTLHYLGYTDS